MARSELSSVARGVMLTRLGSIALSLPLLVVRDEPALFLLLVLVIVLGASLAPLLLWDRMEGVVLRHPLFLGVDIGVSVVFLVIAGTGAPFVVATLATALLAGLLYGWRGAVVAAVMLMLGYAVAVANGPGGGDAVSGDPWFVILALYPLVGVAGWALARLLVRLSAARRAEAAAVRSAAAAEERLRFARDLHDSVGKTLHGIALTAHALRVSGGEAVAAQAAAIEDGARVAAAEARELISVLRAPSGSTCLAERLTDLVQVWGAAPDRPAVELDVAAPLEVTVEVADEVLAIVGEALENVARHAAATLVRVELTSAQDSIEVAVIDDGRGMPAARPAAARTEGRFGLLGTQERAEVLGGGVQVISAPGAGTRLHVVVPWSPEAAATSVPTQGVTA